MTSEELNNNCRGRNYFRPSSGMLLILILLSLFVFAFVGCFTTGDFEVKPTHIIVKPDVCSFLRQYGIPSTNATVTGDGSCAATVPYRSTSFGSGGVIVIEDGPQIKIPDSQVVLVASIENMPFTPTQTRSAIMLGASLLLMLSLMIWFFILMFSSKS